MTDDKSNVTSITAAKNKNANVSKTKKPSWTAANIQNAIIHHVRMLASRDDLDALYPEFFENLRAYRPYANDRDAVLLVSDEREVQLMMHEDLDTFLRPWYQMLFDDLFDGEALSVGAQTQTTKAITPYLKRLHAGDVKIFAFKNEKHYCWKKLNFRLLEDISGLVGLDGLLVPPSTSSETTLNKIIFPFKDIYAGIKEWAPAWFSIIERIKNAQAFISWMGSLMERDVDNHQFLYLYGLGGDGKGTIIRALNKIFSNRLMYTQNIPEEDGAKRFFAANLEGKRVLACPEFPDKGLFGSYLKSLTGGDAISVERKGKDSRNAENHLRVIVASNFVPDIPNNEAARRRIIYCPMKGVGAQNVELGFEDKLVEEAMFFFSIAAKAFASEEKLGRIKQDESVYRDSFEGVHADDFATLSGYFHFYKENPAVKDKDKPFMTLSDFGIYLKQHLTISSIRARDVMTRFDSALGYIKVVRLEDGPVRVVMNVTPKRMYKHEWTVAVDKAKHEGLDSAFMAEDKV